MKFKGKLNPGRSNRDNLGAVEEEEAILSGVN
jgi:hypothetical protein